MTHSCGSCVSHTFICATWLIHLYIHIYMDIHVLHISFVWLVCITHIHMCDMTHSPICAYIYKYICDMTHSCGSCVSHTFICATWPIHLYIHTCIDVHLQNTSFVWLVCIAHIHMCNMTHSPICAYIYMCATWLIRVVRVYLTHSHVRHDSFTYTYIHTLHMNVRFVYVRIYKYIVYVCDLYLCICMYVYVRIPYVCIIYSLYLYYSYMYVCTWWNSLLLIPMSHVTHVNEWLVHLWDRTHSQTQHRVCEHQWVTWHM